MEEIMAFLKENPTFYFATVEGYKPRVRPFGFAMEYKGRLYFAIGKHKAAYKQLRIQGTVDFDNTEAAKKRAFEVMPQLADIYNPESGLELGMVYMDRMSAKLFSMSGVVRDLDTY